MRLTRITLATEDLEAMARFYDAVFDAGLEHVDGAPLLRGALAGVALVLCPNSIAGVVAEQGRHQLRVAVEDLDARVDAAVRAGGRVVDGATAVSGALVCVADPDGNTYELVEAEGDAGDPARGHGPTA